MEFYLFFYFSLIYISALFYVVKPIGKNRHERERSNQNKKSYLWLTGIWFVFLMGLRGVSVGSDTYNYRNIFEALGQAGLFESIPKSMEGYWGYRLLCRMVYCLFGNRYQIFLLCIAIITVGGIFRFIYYASENYIFSVLLFVTCYIFFSSWNASRQFCAIAIGVNAAVELFRNRKAGSIVLYVIACIFHNSAVVFLLIYPLKLIRWNKKIFAIYTFCLIVGMNLIEYLIDIFCLIFPRYRLIYANYLRTGIITGFGNTAQGRKVLVSLFFLAILLLAFVLSTDSDREKGFMNNWFLSAMIMIEIVAGVLFRNNNIILRFQLFFTVFVIVGIPNMVERMRFNKRSRLCFNLLIITVLTIPFVIQLNDNYGQVVPYVFFSKE